MTQLEAVNEMLAAIQESPINSLTGELPSTASRALACLQRASKKVQLKGWSFNCEFNRTLSQNNDGHIPLPAETLSVVIDPSSVADMVPVMLDGKVYDSYGQTYEIGTDLVALKIVLQRSWDLLPPLAQNYITTYAARVFQDEVYGASELRQSTSREEMTALRELRRAHNVENRSNFIESDASWRIIGGGRATSQW